MNQHRDHRQRVKARFLAEGLEHFADHTVLELLLFSAIPQKDTNELAHALLDRFGSLTNVLDAHPEELMKVDGISQHTAVLLTLMPQLARRYFMAGETSSEPYDTADKLGRMFVMKYVGETREVVYLTMLDNSMHIIDTIRLHEGSVNSAHITPRSLIEPCLRKNAALVVLAHNHPSGLPIPSGDDLYTTKAIQSALASVGIPLLEHYLIASNSYTPLLLRTAGLIRQREPSSVFYSGIDHSRFYSAVSSEKLPKFEG